MSQDPIHKPSFVNEEQMLYERRKRTHTQRLDLLMKLMRINRMMKSAKIKASR